LGAIVKEQSSLSAMLCLRISEEKICLRISEEKINQKINSTQNIPSKR